MKPFLSMLLTLLVAVASEPPAAKNYLSYSHWPAKSAKQTAHPTKGKTLMVQIRSDHPVPLVFKGRPGSMAHHTHGHYVQLPHAHAHSHISQISHVQRRPHPMKLTAPVYMKAAPMKQILRQPLKIKLSNIKTHAKPIAANYDKPYKYEKPLPMSYLHLENELPTTTKANFISENFAPIHTIPAPNLALHDNHIHHEETLHASALQPQSYQQLTSSTYNKANTNNNINNHNNNNHIDNQYQVLEEITNDVTFVDPISDSQKLFAPDPDPSLPTSKIRPAIEPYNQPSNGKHLPNDVFQSNHLVPVQPMVQIIGAQHAKLTSSNAYPLGVTAVQQQPFVSEHLTAIQAAPISNYNPTYLVTQSNNLYSQHKQQLFQPHVSNHAPNLVDTGYVHADLTQEVASDGQILQAAKHAQHESLPQFAALIAAPALEAENAAAQVAPFSLPNVASAEPQGGFVISNYYSNGVQDNSQLLQAYAEEEAQRQQQLQAEQAALQLQNQQQQEEQQQQYYQQQEQAQQQRQQQHQLQQIQEAAQAQQHLQSHNFLHEQSPKHVDSATAAFEEHQRLVQQHLGSNTPLRIFVPDDDESRVHKRSGKEPAKADA